MWTKGAVLCVHVLGGDMAVRAPDKSHPPLTFQALLALLDQIVQVPKQVAQQQRSV